VLACHLLLVALCFFTILLSSTIQTLARRHHLLFDNATNRVNAASLFFSFGYVKKKNRNKKKRKEKRKGKRKDRTREQTKKIGKGNKAVVSSRSFLNIT
jgi:hypothetical protein